MMRLTVLGSGTAQPQPDSPASGLLVRTDRTSLLLDCGTGVITRLEEHLDPLDLSAVLVGHLHGDHFLDLVPLRYLFPWPGGAERLLPVFLPPGSRQRIDALAAAISERPGFFDDAFQIAEYDPDAPLLIGDVRLRFRRARHYVPAWSMELTGPDGERLIYLGDTGPSDALVEFARGADLVILESTLRSAGEDDPEGGHLAPEEAIDMAIRSGAARALLVHYPSAERDRIARCCEERGGIAEPAIVGMELEVACPTARATG